ncbi:MAG TPA: lamin tail domain-containing protein, partial [Methanotrichaceae archaeon]|nr:lamin tail domain-containing protein [Methanotrichaceae archaeon]
TASGTFLRPPILTSLDVVIPEGFSLSGRPKITIQGSSLFLDPQVQGRHLIWDLSKIYKGHLVINEFEQNPPGDDKGNEWVEIYNPTPNDIPLDKYYLRENDKGTYFSIPSGTTIPAWGYYFTTWDNGELINSRSLSLSLLYPNGTEIDTTISAEAESSDDKTYECWARYPNGRDTGGDFDWHFLRSTPGLTNGGSMAYSMNADFNLIAEANATSGQTASATLSYEGGTANATSWPIAVREPRVLDLKIIPQVPESGAALGDDVSWTVAAENVGSDPITDLRVSCALGRGLKLESTDPVVNGLNCTFVRVAKGESASFRINTRVASPNDLSLRANATWNCSGRQMTDNATSQIEPSSSFEELSLGLSAPESVNINEPANCSLDISGIVYRSGDDLQARITIPPGFYYSGKAQVFFQGAATSVEPEVDDRDLSFDLGPAVHYSKGIVINEILPSPNESANANYEYVELYNAGSVGVNISDWFMEDRSGRRISNSLAYGRYIMDPGSYLLVQANHYSLNDDGDDVILYDPRPSRTEVIRKTYPGLNSSVKGKSYACQPDGSDNWSWRSPTLGSPNGGGQIRIDFGIMAGPGAASGQPLTAEVSFRDIPFYQSRDIEVSAIPVISGNMSLSLSAPSSVYYSEPKPCALSIRDEGARSRNIVASVAVPAGFRLSGNSTLILSGQSLVRDPEVRGDSLVWSLSSILGSGRHVVINKFEQSPPGEGGRWVELYNPTSSDVDLSGWWLTSRCNGLAMRMPAFSGITIKSGGYYVAACDKGDLPGTFPTNVTLYDSQGRAVDGTPSKADDEHDDRCWARYPDGIGSWQFIPAVPGQSNGGAGGDLYPDGSATIKFNLTTGCGSVSGQNISASVSHSGGTLSTAPKHISVSYGTLTINQTTDVDYVEKGDTARWIVRIENSGSIPVHDVDVGDIPGKGIILRSITSPNSSMNWSYVTIMPGQNKTFQVEATVNATSYLYNLVDVYWGCGSKHTSKKTYVKFKRIITKTPGTDKKYTIGQQVSYLLTATLPKEDLTSLIINNTFPAGITYDPGSLNITGASLQGESRALSDSGPDETTVEWSLGDVLPSAKVRIGFNATLDNSIYNQDGTVIEDCNASVRFADEDGKVTTDSDFGGLITVLEPDLSISESSSTPKGQPKGNQTCTLIISHSPDSHAAAYDVDVKDVLPSGMSYVPGSIRILSGPQGSVDDSDARILKWHFDEIALSKAKSKRVQLRYNVTSGDPMGTLTDNATVTWSSMPGSCPGERDGSGGVNDYLNSTVYQVELPRLTISATGSPDPVYAGDLLTYTIAYQNLGPAPARNVVIRDELDPYATFISSDLSPSDASNNTWKASCGIPDPLLPGDVRYINITALVNESLTNGTKLRNRFTISSDESAPRSGVIYTGVLARSAIKVSKVALQKEVRRGEEVSYLIKVCNRGGLPATNVTIKDLFDSRVDLVSISPAPGPDGAWHVGVMNPGECFGISLTVCIPRTDIAFSMDQGVSGEGFVNVAQDYSTTIEPYILTNYVTVRSDGNAVASNSARVRVLGEPGTSLRSREHGSGSYSSAMTVRYLSKNKSIQMNEEMAAAYMPATLDTPGARPLGFSSEWSRSIYARNEAIGSSITESYRDSKSLDCLSHMNLDENSSTASISSSFQGAAHIGYLKRQEIKSKPVFESSEDYDGRFKIDESTDDYGSGLAYDRSSAGQGFVNINRDIHNRQKVFESGTGDYIADEKIRAFTSYIGKNLTLAQGPAETQHHSGPPLAWRSGIWSWNGDKTLLGEEFSDISRLEVETVAEGLTSLDTKASFSGRERFKAVKKGEIEIDQEYAGNYTLARRVLLSGASRYSYPHITVIKSGRIQTARDCTVARYRICLLNDGNRVLGPVYLRDRFPAGTQFINASLRPSELAPDHANWTLTHLPIGGSSTIDLSLNVTEENDMLVNIVEASGGYDDMLVTAYNLSALEFNWLSCCPPRFMAYKNATQDPDRSQTVDYSLYLRNMANTTVVALVTDSLPVGQEVLSASIKPENVSGRMQWMLMDIAPGEEKVINYDASAPDEGSFSSTAHFEVYALDGSGMGTEEESANIVLPTGLKDGSSGCGTSCPRNDTEASCPCTDEEQSTQGESQGDSDFLPYEV